MDLEAQSSESPHNNPQPSTSLTTPLIKTSNNGYDPYQCPPDFDLAISHGKAKRVYQLPVSSQISGQKLLVLDKELCPCCGLPKHGKLLPLRAKLSELYHLGSGYALYFKLT